MTAHDEALKAAGLVGAHLSGEHRHAHVALPVVAPASSPHGDCPLCHAYAVGAAVEAFNRIMAMAAPVIEVRVRLVEQGHPMIELLGADPKN